MPWAKAGAAALQTHSARLYSSAPAPAANSSTSSVERMIMRLIGDVFPGSRTMHAPVSDSVSTPREITPPKYSQHWDPIKFTFGSN